MDVMDEKITNEGFSQIIKENTRIIRSFTPSCLDHIWTNNLGRVTQSRVQDMAGSDHKAVIVIIRKKGAN